jgi:opacity protein-like surface antigen
MSKFRHIALVLVLLALPASVLGIEKGMTELSAGGGLAIPTGDFGDVAKTGYLFGGGIGYYATPRLAVGAELSYNSFGASDELEGATEALFFYLTDVYVDMDINWSILNVVGYGKYLLTDTNFSPYIKAKAGYYNLKLKVEALGQSEDESESYFGLGGGLGLQYYGEGRLGGFAEALYNNIFADDDNLQFFEVRAGVNILFGG